MPKVDLYSFPGIIRYDLNCQLDSVRINRKYPKSISCSLCGQYDKNPELALNLREYLKLRDLPAGTPNPVEKSKRGLYSCKVCLHRYWITVDDSSHHEDLNHIARTCSNISISKRQDLQKTKDRIENNLKCFSVGKMLYCLTKNRRNKVFRLGDSIYKSFGSKEAYDREKAFFDRIKGLKIKALGKYYYNTQFYVAGYQFWMHSPYRGRALTYFKSLSRSKSIELPYIKLIFIMLHIWKTGHIHNDLHSRNIVFDKYTSEFTVIDFEKSSFLREVTLSDIAQDVDHLRALIPHSFQKDLDALVVQSFKTERKGRKQNPDPNKNLSSNVEYETSIIDNNLWKINEVKD